MTLALRALQHAQQGRPCCDKWVPSDFLPSAFRFNTRSRVALLRPDRVRFMRFSDTRLNTLMRTSTRAESPLPDNTGAVIGHSVTSTRTAEYPCCDWYDDPRLQPSTRAAESPLLRSLKQARVSASGWCSASLQHAQHGCPCSDLGRVVHRERDARTASTRGRPGTRSERPLDRFNTHNRVAPAATCSHRLRTPADSDTLPSTRAARSPLLRPVIRPASACRQSWLQHAHQGRPCFEPLFQIAQAVLQHAQQVAPAATACTRVIVNYNRVASFLQHAWAAPAATSSSDAGRE
jgi:hypothetical protein